MTGSTFIKYLKKYTDNSNRSTQYSLYTNYVLFGISINSVVYGFAQYYYGTRRITYYANEYDIPVNTDGNITYDIFKKSMDFLVKEFDRIYF